MVSARLSPAALTYEKNGADTVRALARQAASAVKLPWQETNALVLRRGPYVIAAGLGESIPNAKPDVLHGRFIDLFNPDLPILTSVTLAPGKRFLLLDLNAAAASTAPTVIAAACRVREAHATGNSFSFLADGIADTEAVVRIRIKRKPTRVLIAGKVLQNTDYDMDAGTLRIRFQNSAQPLRVEVDFAH